MKFSMNGFRRNLSADVESLREIVQAIVDDEYWDKENLVEATNQVITHSNVINCVSHQGDPLFVEMGDIDVKHVEIGNE